MTNTKIVLDLESMKSIKNMVKNKPKVSAKNVIPVLENIKMEVTKNEMLKVSYAHYGDASIEKEFKPTDLEIGSVKHFLVPIQLIKNLTLPKKGGKFSFELENSSQLVFYNGSVNNKVPILDVSDYPRSFVSKSLETVMAITSDTLSKLEKALLSAATSESRPILTTVSLLKNSIVATDSHRLYRGSYKGKINEDDVMINIPRELVKILVDNEDIKDFFGVLKQDHNNMVVETLNSTYYHRMVDGSYPDTSRVIPENFTSEITIKDLKKLSTILTTCKKLGANDINMVTVMEFKDKDKVTISCKSELGELSEELDITTKEFNEFRISFNSNYMLDALKQQGNESTLTFKFSGNMRPFIIEGKKEKDMSLILPVRTY